MKVDNNPGETVQELLEGGANGTNKWYMIHGRLVRLKPRFEAGCMVRMFCSGQKHGDPAGTHNLIQHCSDCGGHAKASTPFVPEDAPAVVTCVTCGVVPQVTHLRPSTSGLWMQPCRSAVIRPCKIPHACQHAFPSSCVVTLLPPCLAL
eukprot:364944-Chlamydomonas_euryale.AAC.1